MGENSSGFTNKSLQDGAFSGDLLDQKFKSPLFPEGGGDVVTNDLCIIIFVLLLLIGMISENCIVLFLPATLHGC